MKVGGDALLFSAWGHDARHQSRLLQFLRSAHLTAGERVHAPLARELPRFIEDPIAAIIEIPAGSTVKYELDKASGLLRVDRVLFSAVHYPANNGFVPRTYCDDGDPLEILAYCQEPIESLAIMRARIIGVMKMHDEKGEDDKLISVHAGDPDYDGVVDLAGLPAFRMRELRRFFQDHKSLENKKALVSDPQGRREALQAVRGASKPYQREKERLLDTDGGGPCRPPAPRLHPARRGRG